MSTATTTEPLPTISFAGGDDNWTLTLDALAVDKLGGAYGIAKIISCAGPATTVRACAALLNISKLSYVEVTQPPDKYGRTFRQRWSVGDKWHVHRVKLGYDQWHLLAIADDPLLMPSYSQRALWQALKSPQFTTPLLRDWVPEIGRTMLSQGLLKQLDCFRCSAAMLTCTDYDLDKIVASGVHGGTMRLE